MGRQANVIFGVHTELVFSPWHDVTGCETVVEDTVCYSVPGPLAGVSLGHRVMQAIIAFLIWGWFPGNCHCAWNILIQLYGTWGLWLVYAKQSVVHQDWQIKDIICTFLYRASMV